MDLLKILDTKPIPSIADARTLGVSGNTSGDYWLPTTMSLYQKELTDQIVSLHYSDILRYFETEDYKEDVVLESMRTMCTNSELVSTHPFLLIDHFLPKSLITKDVPLHMVETSGKFAALRDLINLVQEYETNTAIVCRPGRTMDLLEALLLGNKVNIKRYDGNSIKSKQKPKSHSCICHIFPSKNWDKSKFPIKDPNQFDMLIALDNTVATNDADIQQILKHLRNGRGKTAKAPIVRLITINSIDHCSAYFGKKYGKSSEKYLEKVTAAVVILRDRVGTLPPDLRPIYAQNLNYLLDWLEDPSIPWPLPDMYPIKDYTSMDVERSLLTEVHYTQVEDDLEEAFATKKRGRQKQDKGNIQTTTKKIPFYNTKRVKNQYSTNPLKQDMSQLTGISTGDDSSDVDYHLSSGIITHKLLQSIGDKYKAIELQRQELNDYKSLNPIQNSHIDLYNDERSKINAKYSNSMTKLRVNTDSVNKMEKEISNYKEIISKLERQFEKHLQDLGEKGGDYNKLRELYVSKLEVCDAIEKSEDVNKFRESENEYMQKEIERAEKSIADLQKETESTVHEITTSEISIKETIDKNAMEKDGLLQKIDEMQNVLRIEKSEYLNLKNDMSSVQERLSNIPTPRIRPTGNKR
ncbi:Hda3p NDAI_0J00340 [Naumovozyma dairenensis CBS 421]|uniref:HDA1 complex subunit 3 n=1 Tax=Naumovozyma dairenensis (strain ATCC 10597 / BCRC 20456 / CBS 421 / NBRC 0211 / NRRL Y-12639) TaxID=1071378 RepID=G0WGJ8_NAUDC|nr:hypothetical protein NDAI_0J00340 [Naumovozyma dairenensis CBS 421]CCD26926.1 hypothetical protein NDAI_0J00340 [Naumovozyma dairenensis CBS 421]